MADAFRSILAMSDFQSSVDVLVHCTRLRTIVICAVRKSLRLSQANNDNAYATRMEASRKSHTGVVG